MVRRKKESPVINKGKILKSLKYEEKRNITFSLPASLLEKFKKDCDKNDVKMNQIVQKLIEAYLEQND